MINDLPSFAKCWNNEVDDHLQVFGMAGRDFLKVRQLRVRTDTFADYNSVASPYQFRPGCPLLKRRKSVRLNKNALAFCYRAKGLPMFVHFARAESSFSLSLCLSLS